MLAKRFLVKGVDTVIVRKVCGIFRLTKHQATVGEPDWDPNIKIGKIRLRNDKSFWESVRVLYDNAIPSESTGAVDMITTLLVDYLHRIKTDAVFEAGLGDAMLSKIARELTHGNMRMMCPTCNTVERVKHASLSAEKRATKACCCCNRSWFEDLWMLEWRKSGQ